MVMQDLPTIGVLLHDQSEGPGRDFRRSEG
jgi:hypothetical protein